MHFQKYLGGEKNVKSNLILFVNLIVMGYPARILA